MVIYITMIAASAIIPLIMFIFGIIFIHRPPKHINGLYGYRTRRSMLSQESWDYAHHIVGELWLKLSIFMFVVSFIPFIFILNKSDDVIALTGLIIVVTQTIMLILSVIPVEKELKRKFDK